MSRLSPRMPMCDVQPSWNSGRYVRQSLLWFLAPYALLLRHCHNVFAPGPAYSSLYTVVSFFLLLMALSNRLRSIQALPMFCSTSCRANPRTRSACRVRCASSLPSHFSKSYSAPYCLSLVLTDIRDHQLPSTLKIEPTKPGLDPNRTLTTP